MCRGTQGSREYSQVRAFRRHPVIMWPTMMLDLIGPRALGILSDVMVIGMLLVTFLGLVRMSWVKTYGAWPVNRATRFLDFATELFTNVVGAFNKAKLAAGSEPVLVSPETAARDAAITALEAELSRVRAALLVANSPVAGHPLRAVEHVPTLPPPGMNAPTV